MAISGHRSEASLRNYIGRPSSKKLRACSDILSDALSGRSRWSQQPSFYGAVFPSNLHVSLNSAVIHSYNERLGQFVSRKSIITEICQNSALEAQNFRQMSGRHTTNWKHLNWYGVPSLEKQYRDICWQQFQQSLIIYLHNLIKFIRPTSN